MTSNARVTSLANWGPDKMSFVDKKGKSLVSGRIVKEGKTFYMVQPVDPLGGREGPNQD